MKAAAPSLSIRLSGLPTGLLGGADSTIGLSLVPPAFAAAFLGATANMPGRFNAWGAFLAVYFLATGIVGLRLLGLSGWIEQAFYGAALFSPSPPAGSFAVADTWQPRGEGGDRRQQTS